MLAEIPTGVFIVIVLFFVAMSAVVLAAGVTARKRAALIKATPTSPIGMAKDGYSEFEGRIEAVPGPAVTARLTGWKCAWYHARVEKWVHRGSDRSGSGRWQMVQDWSSEAPFFVRDATGAAIVDPLRAEVTPTDKSQWFGETEEPADRNPDKIGPAGSFQHAFELSGAHPYRYSEERIYAGDPLLVLGEFKTHTFDPADEGDAGATPSEDPEEARADALRAAAQKVTRAAIARGSGKQPFILTTTPQSQHVDLTQKGGIAAIVVALVPLGIAALLLWARFG